MRNSVAVFALLAVLASATAVSPLNEYLPPSEETATIEPTNAVYSTLLTNDGYYYNAQRHDQVFGEYLPPAAEPSKNDAELVDGTSTESASELKSLDEPDNTAVLGENGYEYKTVRRLKYRQRRDVSEVAKEYLPAAEEASTENVSELKSLDEPDNTAVLGENGYEYKTVRRLKYRQRRDVSEVAKEYLSPAEEASTESVSELKSLDEPENTAVLGENGYEYKTVRRLKYRQRRDVSKDAKEYLPPVEEASTENVSELKSLDEPENTAVLGESGYEYKTIRRLKYRQRRDVSEVAKEYLPPAEEASTENVSELKSLNEPENTAVLGENGYEYKTVRRLKYRQRRS